MVNTTSQTLLYAFVPAVFLSGCAASSDKYPSLALRDFEKEVASAAAAPPPPANIAPAPTAMNSNAFGQLIAERDSARSAHAAFMSALPAAKRKAAAARGSGPTANIWADAQLAIADLTTYRSRTAVALGNIDDLIAEASITQRGLPAQVTYQTEVADMVAGQDRAIAALGSGL